MDSGWTNCNAKRVIIIFVTDIIFINYVQAVVL